MPKITKDICGICDKEEYCIEIPTEDHPATLCKQCMIKIIPMFDMLVIHKLEDCLDKLQTRFSKLYESHPNTYKGNADTWPNNIKIEN